MPIGSRAESAAPQVENGKSQVRGRIKEQLSIFGGGNGSNGGAGVRLTSVDLFCGAGGITEGLRQAGFSCLYANDSNEHAVSTFRHNHPDVRVDVAPVEELQPRTVRQETGLA